MKIYIILILTLISTIPSKVKAQSSDSPIKEDIAQESYISLDSLNLIHDFYHSQASLSRTYDYELLNKKRKYEKWSKDIQIFGYGLVLGIEAVGGIFANKYHWSLGWYIPTATALACGSIWGISKWSDYYADKASSIQLSPIYSYNISENLSIQALTVSDLINRMDIGFGIGLTTKF